MIMSIRYQLAISLFLLIGVVHPSSAENTFVLQPSQPELLEMLCRPSLPFSLDKSTSASAINLTATQSTKHETKPSPKSQQNETDNKAQSDKQRKPLNLSSKSTTAIKHLLKAENEASAVGKRILSIGRKMALETKEIIPGSCWDWIHAVYTRAGVPMKHRAYIHKGKKDTGPYADLKTIQAGDWLYYINHSYHGVEHSGIFVRWVNRKKNIAEILSYPGEHRKKPGRYRNYDLSNVYTIIRAKL